MNEAALHRQLLRTGCGEAHALYLLNRLEHYQHMDDVLFQQLFQSKLVGYPLDKANPLLARYMPRIAASWVLLQYVQRQRVAAKADEKRKETARQRMIKEKYLRVAEGETA